MKYFKDCQTLDEVKKLFRKLANEFHPDKGGDTETMQAINKEYSFACACMINGNKNFTQEQKDKEFAFSEAYQEAIQKIANLEGIVIELVGHWIWVTGNTYPVHKTIKEAGFMFAKKKSAWFFRTEEYKTRGGKKSLEEIKKKYGSETVNKAKFSRAGLSA